MTLFVRVACCTEIDLTQDQRPSLAIQRLRASARHNLEGFNLDLVVCNATMRSRKTAEIILSEIKKPFDLIDEQEVAGLAWVDSLLESFGEPIPTPIDLLERIRGARRDPNRAASWPNFDPRAQLVLGRMMEFMLSTARVYARDGRTIDVLVAAPAMVCALPALVADKDFPMPGPGGMVLYNIAVDGNTAKIATVEHRSAPHIDA